LAVVVPKMYALDQAIIGAPPAVVYKAIFDEYAGVTHWWMPYQESKLRENVPIDESAIVDVTIRTELERGTPRFSYKLTKIVEAKSIKVEVTGDIEGTGEWTFEPTDGKTKVQFRWNVRPKRLLYVILSPFVDMAKVHSDVMQKGYKALESYLKEK
jgi:uncharacterized protein YndB with AHSA1/START domain